MGVEAQKPINKVTGSEFIREANDRRTGSNIIDIVVFGCIIALQAT